MHLLNMRPDQIRGAVNNNTPIIMAAGVVEYHGPHLPVGTDALIASKIVEEVEKGCDCVLAPTLPYGPTMSWAGGSGDGEMDFEPTAYKAYVKEILRHFMRMGFKRIYVIQHHQGAEGCQALCIRLAAAELIRETARSWGEGWGRGDYNALPHPDVFGWIKVRGIDGFSVASEDERIPVPMDHAGCGETQFMLGAYPDTVRMEALQEQEDNPVWLSHSCQANPAVGQELIDYCVRGWINEINR